MENLISRLEAVTTRLENIAQRKEGAGGSVGTLVNGCLATPTSEEMSSPVVAAFDAILNGSFAQFLKLSQKIGGDVDAQAKVVKLAFMTERDFLTKTANYRDPTPAELPTVLKPLSDKIAEVQKYRESHRTSALFNHLSAISESIPALGWVAVSPTPGPYVKEMSDAGQFYTNRVLKDFKEKDPVHADWVKAWLGSLSELQALVKQHCTTGVQWNKKGASVLSHNSPTMCGGAPPPPGPPPPPVLEPAAGGGGGGSDAGRSALFSELSKGEDVTKGLRKVSDDQKTHKNPTLRAGDTVPAGAVKSPSRPGVNVGGGSAPQKPPKFELEGKKWVIENQNGKKDLIIKDGDMKQTVYVYKCVDCVLTVKGKVNAITLDGCKKTALVFDEALSSVEFVNCQSVQAQVLAKVPTISIDKTDGCMVYLSKDSLGSQIVTAKSSEMNILVPDPKNPGDFKEFPIPEQFKTHWNGKKFITEATDSIG